MILAEYRDVLKPNSLLAFLENRVRSFRVMMSKINLSGLYVKTKANGSLVVGVSPPLTLRIFVWLIHGIHDDGINRALFCEGGEKRS
jgi:hypothetical protein